LTITLPANMLYSYVVFKDRHLRQLDLVHSSLDLSTTRSQRSSALQRTPSRGAEETSTGLPRNFNTTLSRLNLGQRVQRRS
jgi:hypothetical protein